MEHWSPLLEDGEESKIFQPSSLVKSHLLLHTSQFERLGFCKRNKLTEEKLGKILGPFTTFRAIEYERLSTDICPFKGPCLGTVPGTQIVESSHPVLGWAWRPIKTIQRLHSKANGHFPICFNRPNEFNRCVVVREEGTRLQTLRLEFLRCGPQERNNFMAKIIHEVMTRRRG